jgi:hypothetical protein
MTTPQLPPGIRLDDLIVGIRRARPDDVGAQLGEAVVIAEHLGELSDHLVGHFVDQARRSGLSWTEIGRQMGVSKQAAQKKFVPREDGSDAAQQSFGRFTFRAREAVVAAQEEARRGTHALITPAHLALGLLADPRGLAGAVLQARGLAADAVRDAVTPVLPPAGTEEPPTHIPFDGRAKKALELTFRQALRRGESTVGTADVLLALLELEDGDGPLHALGLDREAVESTLATLEAREE